MNFLLQLPHTNPEVNTTPIRFTKHSNAYMLVYIRESDKGRIICDLDDEDILEHLKVVLDYSFFKKLLNTPSAPPPPPLNLMTFIRYHKHFNFFVYIFGQS